MNFISQMTIVGTSNLHKNRSLVDKFLERFWPQVLRWLVKETSHWVTYSLGGFWEFLWLGYLQPKWLSFLGCQLSSEDLLLGDRQEFSVLPSAFFLGRSWRNSSIPSFSSSILFIMSIIMLWPSSRPGWKLPGHPSPVSPSPSWSWHFGSCSWARSWILWVPSRATSQSGVLPFVGRCLRPIAVVGELRHLGIGWAGMIAEPHGILTVRLGNDIDLLHAWHVSAGPS